MKMMDEGFLPGYYSKLVAEYAVNEHAAWRKIFDMFGAPAAIDMLKNIPNLPHPNAKIGDEIHAAVNVRLDQGAGAEVELTTITAKRMYRQFNAMLDDVKPKDVMSEYTVWSYQHGYAGTGDLMWRVGRDNWVIDLKSGTRLYPKTAMQVAAAAHADVFIDASGNEVPVPKIHRYGGMHVRPMSIRLYEFYEQEWAWRAFLACKELFDWVRFAKEATMPEDAAPVLEYKASIKGIK